MLFNTHENKEGEEEVDKKIAIFQGALREKRTNKWGGKGTGLKKWPRWCSVKYTIAW